MVRFALGTASVIAGAVLNAFLSHRSEVWRSLLAFATSAVLIPAKLLEFRYFVIPYYFVWLNIKPRAGNVMNLATAAVFIFINYCLLHVFWWNDFVWPDGTVARFMF